jgi:dipeptidase D
MREEIREPKEVLRYFQEICQIPRESGHMAAMAAYLMRFAKEKGLLAWRDRANNVLLTKSADRGCEQAQPLILQAHMDMVCRAEPGRTVDFQKDAIRLCREGDILRADGTTLGADDGISVAMMLALLADDTLRHPKLEALFTTDEEIGMLGARQFDCRKLTGRRLINLDAEMEGVLVCGSAGNVSIRSTLPIEKTAVKGQIFTLAVSGLQGGHSGMEIDKNRANANALLARLLQELSEKFDYRLRSLQGGEGVGAIASHAQAEIVAPHSSERALRLALAGLEKDYRCEYFPAEPALRLTLAAQECGVTEVLDQPSAKRIRAALSALPNGVLARQQDGTGCVQASVNWETLSQREDAICLTHAARSALPAQKAAMVRKIAAIAALAGGRTQTCNDTPGWRYRPDSPLRDTISRTYQTLTGKAPAVEVVHAGLECGYWCAGVPEMDCVSLGPDMAQVHTPAEHLSISSAARVYQLLRGVLEECGG